MADNPNHQPVETPIPPQGHQAAPEVQKSPEQQQRQANEDQRLGASNESMKEVLATWQGPNTDGRAENADAQLNGAANRGGRAANDMTEAQMAAQGITVVDGVRMGPDGRPVDGERQPNRAGETNPDNPALATLPDGHTLVNCELNTGVPQVDGTVVAAAAVGDGHGQNRELPPTPPREHGDREHGDRHGDHDDLTDDPTNPHPGHEPVADAKEGTTTPGQTPTRPGTVENQLTAREDETYRVSGTATTEPTLARRSSTEVNALEDRATPGGGATLAAAGGARGLNQGATTLADAGPGTPAAGRDFVGPPAPPAAPVEVASVTPVTQAGSDAAVRAVEAGAEGTRTPEQRAEAATRALEAHFANGPHAAQVGRDLATFNARTDITAEQKAQALENLVHTANGDRIEGNGSRSNMSQENVNRAVAGGINDIAKPRNIDQGNHGTCNATVLQVGQATDDPARYTAQLREAALHGTYTGDDGFKARIPSDMMTPDREGQLAQDTDGKRNFSSQLMQGGMLNHYWQQHGQYYTETAGGGEQRYRFDSSQANAESIRNGGNPFTTEHTGSGAGVGANEVGFMGRNFGIQGQFVFAQASWVGDGPVDPSVRVVGSPQELTQAKLDRERQTGSSWGVAVVHSGNGLFTGSDGQGGTGGGHVVSTFTNGDLDNQWGGGFDRTGVSDSTLFAAMNKDPRTTSGDGPGGRGQPAGRYDDTTLPERYDQHRRENPNAHRDSITHPDGPLNKDKDKEKDKEHEKDPKKAEEDDPTKQRLNGARRASLQGNRAQLEGQLRDAQINARLSDLTTGPAMVALYSSRLDGINTEISRIA